MDNPKKGRTALFLWFVVPVLSGCGRPVRPPATARKPDPARISGHPNKTAFLRQSGLNLPWIAYGHDVGWPHVPGKKQLIGFRHMKKLIPLRARLPMDLKTLRVWMLADDRAGVFGPASNPGFAARCIRDMNAFMEATPPDVTVIWVIYDFMIGDGRGSAWGGKMGEPLQLVRSAAGWSKAWTTLIPCIRAVQKKHGSRIIWDIINEPMNGSRLVAKDEQHDQLEGFIRHHLFNLLAMKARVSFGARSLSALRHTWKPLVHEVEAERKRLGLSPDHFVVQFHHYPDSELHRSSSLRTFTGAGLRRELGLDPRTPVLLGEVWSGSGFTLKDYFAMGFAGVLFWQDERIGSARSAANRQAREFLAGRPRPWKPVPVRRLTGSKKDPAGVRPSGRIRLWLSSCWAETDGSPWDRPWQKKLGFKAGAFTGAVLARSGDLFVTMDVEADPDLRARPLEKQHRRKGEIVCSLGKGKVLDLRGAEITLRLVPPVEAVAQRFGSGMQILLQDSRGRRMHGSWNSFSPLSGGNEQVIRFRPPTRAVPGMGFRHPGFDLSRVTHVGFLWAAATFSRVRYRARMKLRRIEIEPAVHPERPLVVAGQPSVFRPERNLNLASCRLESVPYVYLMGLSGKGPYFLNLDPKDRYRWAGALAVDLATGCPSPRGRLLDLKDLRLEAGVSGPPGPVRYQLFVTDDRGRSCYSRKTAGFGKTLSVKLDYGPTVCSYGSGVDFRRIRRVGIKFFLPAGSRKKVRGRLSVVYLKLLSETGFSPSSSNTRSTQSRRVCTSSSVSSEIVPVYRSRKAPVAETS